LQKALASKKAELEEAQAAHAARAQEAAQQIQVRICLIISAKSCNM
jgi:hypothetical protein